MALRLNHVALGFYFSREYEAAIEAAKRGIRSHPDFPSTYRWLAAALGQIGRTAEAKEALEKAIAVAPASFDMSARGLVRGIGQKTTPTCLKVCARRDGRIDSACRTRCPDPGPSRVDLFRLSVPFRSSRLCLVVPATVQPQGLLSRRIIRRAELRQFSPPQRHDIPGLALKCSPHGSLNGLRQNGRLERLHDQQVPAPLTRQPGSVRKTGDE